MKISKKRHRRMLGKATELGAALGILLAHAKQGLYPFVEVEGNISELIKFLEREYDIGISRDDFEVIRELFNCHPQIHFTLQNWTPERREQMLDREGGEVH